MERDEQIKTLLGGPEYKRLFEKARERIELDGASAKGFALNDMSKKERTAVSGLFGLKKLPGKGVRINIDRLDQALRNSRVETSLLDVLVILGGPLRDIREERRAEQKTIQSFWDNLEGHPTIKTQSDLIEWVKELKGQGLLLKAANREGCTMEELSQSALAVLGRLPANGTSISVLAANAIGDAHALDKGRALSGIVLRGVSKIVGIEHVPPGDAGRRMLWSAVGVYCDPLSSRVLVYGLRPSGDKRLCRHLRECSDDHAPVVITLSEIERAAIDSGETETVYVCENPTVVFTYAEDGRKPRAPLVCTEGQPSRAAVMLLKMLARSGSQILFHCDFDWSGISIGNFIYREFKASSWRFSAKDYVEEVEGKPSNIRLGNRAVDANWDHNLTNEMLRTGYAILEEHCIRKLLEDLSPLPSGHRDPSPHHRQGAFHQSSAFSRKTIK